MGLRKRPYNENKGASKKANSTKSFGKSSSGEGTRKPKSLSKSGSSVKRSSKRGEDAASKEIRFDKKFNSKEHKVRNTSGKDFKGKKSFSGKSFDRNKTEGEFTSSSGFDRTSNRKFGSKNSGTRKPFDKDKQDFSKSKPSYKRGEGKVASSRFSDDKPRSTRYLAKTEDDNKPRYSRSGKPFMVKGAKARDVKAKSEEMIENATPEIIRLNRFISNAGVCSRREADDLIKAGLVSVNGTVITEMGYKVNPGDDVRYNNQRLQWEKKVYLLMNKPKDTITTSDDPDGRHIIMDLIKDPRLPRVYPVGRLDRNTTGVILLTNDGELAQRLTHPKYNVTKIYKATLNKNFTAKDLHDLSLNGVELEDGPIKPDAVGIPSASEKDTIHIQIHSGRNRIIHRMFEAMNYTVEKLDRLEFAGIDRKGLIRGAWRHLDEKEIRKLKKLVQLK